MTQRFQRPRLFRVFSLFTVLPAMLVAGEVTGPAVAQPVTNVIINRYRSLLLKQDPPEASSVQQLMQKQQSDGSWDDIDYQSRNRSGWSPIDHVRRLRDMTRAWAHPHSSLHQQRDLHNTLIRGLEHWVDVRPKSDNWWFNQIGTPRAMRDILVLLVGHLPEELRARCIDVVKQNEVKGTGANLLWTAEVKLHRSCLSGNTQAAKSALKKILGEIVIGEDEGIQEDFSFFQHGARLQSFHYGGAYLDVVTNIGWQVRGTKWAFPDAKIRIISRFMLEGLQWQSRNGRIPPSVLDRAASRKGSLTSHLLAPAAERWAAVDPRNRRELLELSRQVRGNQWSARGFRHFYRADFSAYHGDGFSFFLKTISDRTRITEQINNENQRGTPYLNWGDHYLIQGSQHPYAGLQPIWDWSALPGLTVASDAESIDRRAWAGGVSNRTSGGVTMHGIRTSNQARLGWKKLWFFHDGAMVCLTADFEANQLSSPVRTSLEYSRLRGPVHVLAGDSVRKLDRGKHHFRDTEGIWHNGTSYVPFSPAESRVHNREGTGNWHRINRQYSKSTVRADVFHARLIHGQQPEAHGYVIHPNTQPDELQTMVRDSSFEVLRNDKTVQAVQGANRTGVAAFHRAGKLSVPDRGDLVADAPCLILWTPDGVFVSDPAQGERNVTIRMNGRRTTVDLPGDGSTVRVSF